MTNQLTKMGRFGVALLTFALTVPAFAAPPGQNQKFVKGLYEDLLERTPNKTESAAFVALLGVGATRTQIAGSITSSNEYRTEQIQLYYGKFLNRRATAGEVTFFLSYLQQGATDDDVKSAILGGDEFFAFTGGSVQGFLNQMFLDVLGRPVDPNSALAFQTLLGQGKSRQEVAGLVLHSIEADQYEVKQLFQKFLRRLPSTAELDNFSTMLQAAAKDEFVIDALCGSDEYFRLVAK